MEPWQQWAAAAITFLSGLAAIWATLRATWRKDRISLREDAASAATISQQNHEDALEKCWGFARNRQKYYEREVRSLKERIRDLEDSVEELRRELHGVRNSWSQEQLLRVRLEEELKYLRQDLTGRERDEDRQNHQEYLPPPLPPIPPAVAGGGT